jgi:hypothetical protein
VKFDDYVAAAAQLQRIIREDPALRAFIPIAELLVRQANELNQGARALEHYNERAPAIPTREQADKLLAAMALFPQVHPEKESAADLRLISTFLGNMALGVASAIHRDFPDAVPRTRTIH